ncbi:serine protease 40 isoform X2 [Rattus norvegicus]|uniref:serine protease 40 isoform X2 n=1 Tax=Rattus norvegicus TaxID=10116 RepID=UPI0003D09BD4|nr:serine protease 40 isoform X2 [Rattus norvegicus]|eukprot:XP_006244780.1 PREDICTED: serine protease 40 isoform X2 [Rattus norvegicus]
MLLPPRSLFQLHAQDYKPSQTPPPTSDALLKPMGRVQKEICGKTKFQGKIYGGSIAKAERWPWQASLIFRGRHICGAVLIDKNWVASAAHCFKRSLKPSDYRILLGYNELSNPSNYSRQMTLSKVIVHEDYNKLHSQEKDIVLIQLHLPVRYSSHIFPVCVPDQTTKEPSDESCWISGWGMVTDDKFLQAPFPLLDSEVFLMNDQECEAFFQTPQISITEYDAIKDDMICAGDITNQKSTCRGDSGGPLVCLLDSYWYLVGLASWSGACLEPIHSPSIFTRVSHFSDWIEKKKADTPDVDPSLAPLEETAPSLIGWRNYSAGTTLEPRICTTLLSSQVLLLQSIWLRIL